MRKVGDVEADRSKGGSWWLDVPRESWSGAVDDEQERIRKLHLDPTASAMAKYRAPKKRPPAEDEEV